MSFAESLASRRFALALEITPPQRSLPRVLGRRAGLLADAAEAINVIQRPDRQSSLEASGELVGLGAHPAWHLVTRGRTEAMIAADLDRAAASNIRQILCIRGDHDVEPGAPEVTIRRAIELAAARMPGALIGATLNQYVRDRPAALKNLLPKLAAGASYVQTQPVFDLAALTPLAGEVKAHVPGTSIIAMAMPLVSAAAASGIAARLGIELPGAGEGGVDAAWERFAMILAELVESPLVDGVAIMTYEMDPHPETGERILQALRLAGALPRPADG